MGARKRGCCCSWFQPALLQLVWKLGLANGEKQCEERHAEHFALQDPDLQSPNQGPNKVYRQHCVLPLPLSPPRQPHILPGRA